MITNPTAKQPLLPERKTRRFNSNSNQTNDFTFVIYGLVCLEVQLEIDRIRNKAASSLVVPFKKPPNKYLSQLSDRQVVAR